MATIDQQFVEYIVKSLVENEDAVLVERTLDEKGVLLTLTVDPEDLGRVIGRRGSNAQSLRTLLRALGTKNAARYNLKIIDNDRIDGDFSGEDEQPVETPTEVDVDNDSSRASDYAKKSREELAELDDLDI